MTCDKCGAPLQVGEWPWCPHGFPSAGLAVIDDTVIGGRWCETIGHEPFFYTSKKQLQDEATRRGLVNVDRHDAHYYAQRRKWHDEKLRDTGTPY